MRIVRDGRKIEDRWNRRESRNHGAISGLGVSDGEDCQARDLIPARAQRSTIQIRLPVDDGDRIRVAERRQQRHDEHAAPHGNCRSVRFEVL